jgi:hypothetical protein
VSRPQVRSPTNRLVGFVPHQLESFPPFLFLFLSAGRVFKCFSNSLPSSSSTAESGPRPLISGAGLDTVSLQPATPHPKLFNAPSPHKPLLFRRLPTPRFPINHRCSVDFRHWSRSSPLAKGQISSSGLYPLLKPASTLECV